MPYLIVGFMLAIMVPLLLIALHDSLDPSPRRWLAYLAAAWLPCIVVVTLVVGIRERNRDAIAQIREHDRYHLTDNALVRHRFNEADVTIRFDEIRFITESAEWLVVKSSIGWNILIPRVVAGYDELRSALSKYKPIVAARTRPASFAGLLLPPLVLVLAIVLMVNTHDHVVRDVSAVVLVVVIVWLYILLPLLRLALCKKASAS